MEITIKKTVEIYVKEELDANELKVVLGFWRDVDSQKFNVYYKGVEIASGHLNTKTNFAHVTMKKYDAEIEDYLVDGIENRTINLD